MVPAKILRHSLRSGFGYMVCVGVCSRINRLYWGRIWRKLREELRSGRGFGAVALLVEDLSDCIYCSDTTIRGVLNESVVEEKVLGLHQVLFKYVMKIQLPYPNKYLRSRSPLATRIENIFLRVSRVHENSIRSLSCGGVLYKCSNLHESPAPIQRQPIISHSRYKPMEIS